MLLHGHHLIAGHRSREGEATIRAFDPVNGESLEPAWAQATRGEIDRAARAAESAAVEMGRMGPERRAEFIERIAELIEERGSVLIERVMAETGLPEGRVTGERARTTAQLRLFASVVRDGSWVDARIDRALPSRKPIPRPDIRRMLTALGPVAVFGASNFPLAFSVAGGDTASAFAAGCPVVCKAHPSHPGTSEIVADAIAEAVRSCGFPDGTFSLLHGAAPSVSIDLVTHPSIRAVGFTGSLQAGRALFDAAAGRPDPIPVFAEMGSVNPVIVLPGAARDRGEAIAAGLVASIVLGSGQFCTNPGLVIGVAGEELNDFAGHLRDAVSRTTPQVLLNTGIRAGFERGTGEWAATAGVRVLGSGHGQEASAAVSARPAVFVTEADVFIERRHLHAEVFGPVSLLVQAANREQLLASAQVLEGNLTATLHATDQDLADYGDLVEVLQRKVGRLILNGFPTGVEVCPSMHHGGPWPATTDARSTSVGTAAMLRFARPICYQDFPETSLPAELRNANPKGIWRMVDGRMTRDAIR